MLLFFKSSTPYISKHLRVVEKSVSALRVVEKFQIKDVEPLSNMDNVID